MHKPLALLCYTAIAITACQAPAEEAPDELIVPLAEVAGSGPFLAGKGALMANRPDSDLTPLYEAVAGLPEGLDSLTIGQWEADFVQWIYQGYHNQRIDSAVAYRWLDDLRAEDTLWYTKESIDVQVSLAFGTNAAGQKVVVVDQDNDEDLADEAVFVFTKQDSLTLVDGPPAAQDSIGVFRVQYERYRINSFPSTFLVNPAGKVISKNTGLRGHSLIETLADALNVPTDTLTHKISRGNVLLALPGEASDQWLIRADFTQDHPLPLYHSEDRWQRGFDLVPGTYAYTLESYAYNVKPQQGTFTVGDSEEPLTVTLSSQTAR